jgi:hypothetical protein
MFPFNHDPNVAGGNAVGKALNVRGPDGKPVVMTVKEILMGDAFRAEPALVSVNGKDEAATDPRRVPGDAAILAQSPAQKPQGKAPGEANNFREPAPLELGDGVTLAPRDTVNGKIGKTAARPPAQELAFPCPSCGAKKRFHKKGCMTQATEEEKAKLPVMAEAIQKQVFSDPHLLAMEARVSSGPDRDETPTLEDLKDLERDRECRASGRPDPELRPGEGYAPPVMR